MRTKAGLCGFYVKEFFDEVVCAVDVEAHAILKSAVVAIKMVYVGMFVAVFVFEPQNYAIISACASEKAQSGKSRWTMMASA